MLLVGIDGEQIATASFIELAVNVVFDKTYVLRLYGSDQFIIVTGEQYTSMTIYIF